jgi:hypothetical protein
MAKLGCLVGPRFNPLPADVENMVSPNNTVLANGREDVTGHLMG